LIGPWTLAYVTKTQGRTRAELLKELAPLYSELLRDLKKKGFEWVQLEEPAFCVDLQKDEPYEVAVDTIFHSLQHLPIPTIVLIEGLAVGSGLLIATACDFRIATDDARFGIPVAKTLGNCLSPSNLSWIAYHLGVPMVKRMLLTAELIKAPELLNSGYLYQTTSPDAITELTEALASKLVALAPITQKASKVTLARLMESNLPDCTELMRETYNSVDFKEGVNAFLEGRPPQWLGK
jgi:enoyl-CoA hydratase/carnithine racemase